MNKWQTGPVILVDNCNKSLVETNSSCELSCDDICWNWHNINWIKMNRETCDADSSSTLTNSVWPSRWLWSVIIFRDLIWINGFSKSWTLTCYFYPVSSMQIKGRRFQSVSPDRSQSLSVGLHRGSSSSPLCSRWMTLSCYGTHTAQRMCCIDRSL